MLRVKSGIRDAPVTALFAVSDAIRPSTSPWVKVSGCLEARLDSLYAKNAATSALAAGMMPMITPMTEDLIMVAAWESIILGETRMEPT